LPSCKHKGIGTQLLKAGLAELKTMNFEKTLVYCLTENKNGCAFYEKKGGVLINAALVVEFNETMNIYTFDLATSCL